MEADLQVDCLPLEAVGLHSVRAVSVAVKRVGLERASAEVRLAELDQLPDLGELDLIVRRRKADSTVFLACHPTRASTVSAARWKGRAG